MSFAVDASGRDLRSVSRELKAAVEKETVTIGGAAHIHGLAAGLTTGDVSIEGNAGDYLGVLNSGAAIRVRGDAGRYLADNMTSGTVVVDGDAGHGVGQYCYGGTVIVRGSCGDFTAVMNKGATIVIGGNVGDEAATYMLAGDLVIAGDAGINLGNYLIRGNIYVGGNWESLGNNTLLQEMTESDHAKLSRLLSEYHIDGDTNNFRKIGPLSEKPFYKAKVAIQKKSTDL